MKWYYEDPDNVKRLRKILASWLGTPFRHMTCVKHMGCDCVHLLAAVTVEQGILDKVIFAPYAPDAGQHSYEDLMSEMMSRIDRIEKVGTNELMDGDMILVQFAKVPTHAGIYLDKLLYHSVWGAGVVRMPMSDPMITKVHSAYRVKA